MTTMERTIQQAAREMLEAMETRKRDNGETFYALADGSPEWMVDVAHAAHGDMMPDDTRCEMLHDALEELSEDEDADAVEIADRNAPIYTHELLAWAASHGERVGFVDEAMSEYETESLWHALTLGWMAEFREVFAFTLTALEDVVNNA